MWLTGFQQFVAVLFNPAVMLSTATKIINNVKRIINRVDTYIKRQTFGSLRVLR